MYCKIKGYREAAAEGSQEDLPTDCIFWPKLTLRIELIKQNSMLSVVQLKEKRTGN